MELRLVVASPAGESELAVQCDPQTPAGEVLAELAGYLELPPAEARSAACERTGRTLAADRPIGEAGLRDGDRLVLGRTLPAPDGDGALVDLVVVGGPDSGVRIGLGEGRHVVGRGPGADVVLHDRSMSRRHLAVDVRSGALSVADAGSSNGTYVEGAALTGTRPLTEGEVVEAGRSLLTFAARRAERRDGGAGAVAFNRPPRIARPAPPAPVVVPAPPEEGQEARLPGIAALLPLVIGVVLWRVLGNPVVLLFGLLAPVMALSTYLDTRRRGRSGRRRSLAEFEAALDEAAAALEDARRGETEQRRAAAPGADALRARVERLEPALWERRPQDEDFLELRVGVADRPPAARIELERGGERRLRERALEILDAERPLVNVPVTLPLGSGAAGIAADAVRADALARWLVLQAAVLHSPSELRIEAVLPEGARETWGWLSWLPHVAADAVVSGRDAGTSLLERPPSDTHRLVLVHGDAGVTPRALEAALERDASALWLAGAPQEVPGACGWLVTASGEAGMRVTEVATGDVVDDLIPDGVPAEWAAETARLLAGVRDAGAASEREAVPARVSLLDLLRLPDPSRHALAERWRADRDGSLSAPIGQTATGPFTVDAGASEGLRMLVAGMPGAGKSELLQTLIASLAAEHPPTRLTFLLVDYKGGSAFRDCARLPHTVGLVTDLDAALADRARVSLLAELRRRESLLADAGARSLRELQRRDPGAAPPALLIVVDEFATLGRELPAFVDTLVDVAQRGRSLGLHLVLATQRPRGAVNDTLRANTNLRVAMRVADAAESRDVVEAVDAASIPAALPGRALALTGRRPDGGPRLTEFQAGYAGGRTSGLGAGGRVVVRPLGGTRHGDVARVLSTVGGSLPTDLGAIVAAARDAAEHLGLPAQHAPWLPALPAEVPLASLGAPEPGVALLGLVDEPGEQRRRPLRVSLAEDGHLLVFGASGSGRTTVLRALACSLAEGTSPRELHLYGLDFAAGGLEALEALPHCGSVIGADDDERVLRLLGWLGRVIASRKRRAGPPGWRPGDAQAPRIVVLLDGYAAFSQVFERVDMGEPVRALARIASEGRALGVHLVATADRRAEIPGTLAGVVGTRVVLRMASDDESVALGVPRSAAGRDLPPGRGFTRDGAEAQVAWVAPEDVRALGERLAAHHPDERAPAIGTLPSRVARASLPRASGPLQAVIGLDDEHLQPTVLDLEAGNALVAGPHRSGLTTALATIAAGLRDADPGLALHLLAPRRSALTDLAVWTSAAGGTAACEAALERLAVEAGDPAVVVVDDAMELAEGLAATRIEALLRASRDARVRVVAAVDVHLAQRAFGGWVRDLRAERTGLLLQPAAEGDGDLLGARLPLRPGTALPPGRGFLVARGAARLVQVALP